MLYKRLKLRVAKEETLIYDNTEELTKSINDNLEFEQAKSIMDLDLQRQLLIKVDSVKSYYSQYLFLVEHFVTLELTNCKGL